MNAERYDVIIAKDFEIQKDGAIEKRTAWHKVGVAWNSKTSDAMHLELFLIPGQRYVIKPQKNEKEIAQPSSDEGRI